MHRSRRSHPPLTLAGLGGEGPREVHVGRDGRVAAHAAPEARRLDLEGACLQPGLVNAHDHLDLSTLPPVGTPPFVDGYAWAEAVTAAAGNLAVAFGVSLPTRLWLGGLRNLLAGTTATVQHGSDHRSFGRPDFPVRVQQRYEFAHSPGLTPALRKSYRTTDRRIPFFVHAGEGANLAGELQLLAEANVLRHNTVIARGLAFGPAEAARMAEAEACLAWCPEADRWQYGRTADIRAMLDAGVRVGLGSECPAAGARDLLSTLAAARAEGVLDDDTLLTLATHGSAVAARLPVGGFEPGDPADFTVVASRDAWFAGQRTAVLLVIVAGQARYGTPSLLAAAGVPSLPLEVDGSERALPRAEADLLRGVLRAVAPAHRAPWMASLG